MLVSWAYSSISVCVQLRSVMHFGLKVRTVLDVQSRGSLSVCRLSLCCGDTTFENVDLAKNMYENFQISIVMLPVVLLFKDSVTET